jgi:hypothetical protein
VNQKQRVIINKAEIARRSAMYGLMMDGAKAIAAGLTPVDCPHALGTREQQAWYAGWILGYDRRYRQDV